MSEFLEYEETEKYIKTLNLDDFSVEDLNNYIKELKKEIDKVEKEIQKKSNLLKDAQNYFK